MTLPKEKARSAIDIAFLHNLLKLCYKSPSILHAISGLILNLAFSTEYPDRVVDTVKIFLLPDPSLSDGSEVGLVYKGWYTGRDRVMLTIYEDTASLFQSQNIAPIVGYEALVNMLEQREVFLVVMIGHPGEHLELYNLNMLIDVSE